MLTTVSRPGDLTGASSALAGFTLAVLTVAIVVEVTNLDGVLAPGNPLPSRAVLAVAVLTAALALRDPASRARLNRVTVIGCALVACYLISQVLSALGSQDPGSTLQVMRNAFSDAVFIVTVLVLNQVTGRPWAVAAAFVAPMAVLCALCLVNQVGFEGTMTFGGFATVTDAVAIETPRYGGPLPDSNFWGRHLVMALPLAGALAVRAAGFRDRWAMLGWAAAVLSLLAGVYLTQSRGTIIATAVAAVVWIAASGGAARRRAVLSLPLLAVVLLAPGIGNRLVGTLADISGHSPHHVVDPSIVGRMAAQQIAWAMFDDRPLFGFGPGTFKPVGIPEYAGTVRTAVFQYTSGPDAPHNLYAQLAGETGIVGLIGWLTFVGGVVVLLALRINQLAAGPVHDSRSLTAAVLAALIGWSAASAFLHLAYFRTFGIMVAFAVALAATAPAGLFRAPLPLRQLRQLTVAGLAGICAAGAVLAVSTSTSERASQRLTLIPTERMTMNYSYSFGIRTAEVLLPTFAVLLTAGSGAVSASSDTVRGLITVEAGAPSADVARERLAEGLAEARRRMADSHSGSAYSLVEVGGMELTTARHRSRWATAAAALIGLVGAATVRSRLRRPVPASPARAPAP